MTEYCKNKWEITILAYLWTKQTKILQIGDKLLWKQLYENDLLLNAKFAKEGGRKQTCLRIKKYRKKSVSEYLIETFLILPPMSMRPTVGPAPLTIRVFTTLQSDPRDWWPLGHLVRVMRRHDMTKRNWQRQIQRQWQRQRHFKNTS